MVQRSDLDTTMVAGDGGERALSTTRRMTKFGLVDGMDSSATTGTFAWFGVPYAQPPVGPLRWQAPVDPQPWTGVRAATRFGHACAQVGRYFSPAPDDAPYGLAVREGFGKPVGSEDCLTLNIWRPADDQQQLPVIVFIHGGSAISGYSGDPICDGQALARKANAVVVTLNYRLGPLGWFDLPQLKTGDADTDSGNFGLLDQLQALRFIQGNIASFGGDAGNVTVMGQSAGAANVWALMMSPRSAELMHKALPLSGGIAHTSRGVAQKYSTALLEAMVVADGKAPDADAARAWIATQSNSRIANYLRGWSSSQLLTVVRANPQLGNSPSSIEDGNVLPLDSVAALKDGRYRKIPVLAGNTRDEGTLLAALFGAVTGTGIPGFAPSDYDRFGLQFEFDPDAPTRLTEADLISTAYLPVTAQPFGWNASTKLLSDKVFGPVVPQLDSLSSHEPAQVWYYRFDWDEQAAPFDVVYGATHALDLPFVFGNFEANAFSFAFGNANRPGREALSDAMMASVSAFARTGNPNNSSLGVTWPNWPAVLVFDATPTQLQVTVQ